MILSKLLFQTDIIISLIFWMLIIMSVFSWTIILNKLFSFLKLQKLLDSYILKDDKEVVVLCSQLQYLFPTGLDFSKKNEDKIQFFFNKHLKYGMTMLASVGSSAPFIGLFGTVWGIYFALIDISAEGTASIDVVAKPMGEALIATAFGLFAAIPAVIAFNFFKKIALDINYKYNIIFHGNK